MIKVIKTLRGKAHEAYMGIVPIPDLVPCNCACKPAQNPRPFLPSRDPHGGCCNLAKSCHVCAVEPSCVQMCTKCKPLFADECTAIGASAHARVAPCFSAVTQPTLPKLTDYTLNLVAYVHKQTELRMHDHLLR
jgi:hypothetical protein